MENKNKFFSSKKSVLVISLVVVLVFVVLAILKDRGVIAASKDLSIVNVDAVVEYKEFNNIKSYVETLNKLAYNDDVAIVSEFLPDEIVYQDTDGNVYITAVTSTADYVEKMNYYFYNDKYEVIWKFIPQYLIYQQVSVD